MPEFDVREQREKFIGGSDIPIIMGLSPFKTRWQLLLEKSGLAEDDFQGNKYTEYGNEMEGKIRAYINGLYSTKYNPDRKIVDDLRFHCDGNDGSSILEIKTTSGIHDNVNDYKLYLVQLVAYMNAWGYNHGMLAVYERPADFSLEFDPERLHIYDIDMQEYKSLLDEINAAVARFRADLERLKNNPLLSEEDFQPNEIVALSAKLIAFENQLAAYKTIEQEYKQVKQQLYEAMANHNVKTWETVNGVKITRVDATETTLEPTTEFDEKRFATTFPNLYDEFTNTYMKEKKGRAGYVKITLPKE